MGWCPWMMMMMLVLFRKGCEWGGRWACYVEIDVLVIWSVCD